MGGIGLPELIIIFLVILLLFGAKALPEVAKGLAQAMKIFKKEVKEIKDGLDTDLEEDKKDTPKEFDTKAQSKTETDQKDV